MTREELFELVVPVPESGCWLWPGTFSTSGYGRIFLDGKPQNVHRVAWRIFKGEPPRGMFICHKCDTRPCCNPDHLFLGTHKENMRDMVAKGRSGHDYKRDRKGDKNGRATLTTEQVIQMRIEHANRQANAKELAARYGLHSTTIYSILRKSLWKHVP